VAEISVVIPVYNARDGLARCLASLRHSTIPLEVVIVDDGSADGTRDVVQAAERDLDLRYRFVPRTSQSGRAAARNLGVHTAANEIILFVDADEIVPPTLAEQHLRYHRIRPDAVVLGPRGYLPQTTGLDLQKPFRPDDHPDRVDSDARDQVLAALSDNLNDLATCWHYLFTCNASVRRDALLDAGGFDEGFSGWGLEDSELGYRLRRRGMAFAYHPGARIYHQHRQTMTPRMYEEWCGNLRYFIERHPHPEVAAQKVLAGVLDPARRDISWLEAARRFEYATRAMHGRLPDAQTPWLVIDVNATNAADVRRSIDGWARESNLVVFDHLGDPDLLAAVQCTTTGHEFRYHTRPTDTARARSLAGLTHRVVSPAPESSDGVTG
jgi:GT2 family glycosyltransferase